MKSGLEVYISLIILTIMALTGASFLAANATTLRARDAQSSYVIQIEDSDWAPSVIKKCQENAKECGFVELSVDSNTHKIELIYNYSMPILNIDNQHSIISYAR